MKSSSFARCAFVVLALLVFLRPTTPQAAMGDLDTTFGPNGDGMVTTNFNGNTDEGYSVVLQSDGKILVAGTVNNDFALARYDSNGNQDTTFGPNGDGMVTTDLDSDSDDGRSVAVQNDGKILLAGTTYNAFGHSFALARYTSEGELDDTFGGGDGMVTTDFGSHAFGNSVATQDDAKIVLAGYASNGSNYDFALARYTSEGELDTDFGTNGLVTTNFGSTDYAYSVAIQRDGKIVLAGYANSNFALARYTSEGELDTTFGTNGLVTTNFSFNSRARSMAIQDDGKIVLAGYASTGGLYDFALARYESDGELDTTFGGGDGTVITDFGFDDYGHSVTIQDDGKIVLAGYTQSSFSAYDFALARYDSDGELDTTFSNDGMVITDFGSYDYGHSVIVQDGGKIVVAGEASNGSDDDFALARYIGATTPTLTTASVTSVTTSSATSGGNVTYDGGVSVTQRGVCWNTSGSPATSGTCSSDGTGTGTFGSSLTGLSPSTTYYVRAYAANAAGTAYGGEESFTTTATTPTVTTTAATDITSSSATSGGNVTDDGGSTVIARGVCWNTSGSPTTSDTCSSDGTGTGTFGSSLTGLSPSTTYYIRAYAANSLGTAYGGERSFTTSEGGSPPETPSVETGTPEPTSCTCATIPGNVTDEGGTTVSERGVCYTMVNSSEEQCVSCSSSGGGSFSVELTGLEPATQYTVFAYAVNSEGTGQGTTTIFTTPALHDHVLFLRNTQSGQTALMYFSGVVRQGYALSVQAGQVWQARDVEDFDQDNSPDTMWQNLETGQMVLVSMNSYLSGEIRGKGSYPEWSASVCGDFNGDGHKDAAWRDSESGQVVAQLFENLEPVKLRGTLELSNLGWHLSAAGDFNADGTDDLIFRNQENGRVGIVLIEDALYASVAFLPDVGDQTFSVVAALDMDLDGSTDLVWHNATTGDLYVQYLSGLEHLHYGYLTHAPLEWIPFGGASYEK